MPSTSAILRIHELGAICFPRDDIAGDHGSVRPERTVSFARATRLRANGRTSIRADRYSMAVDDIRILEPFNRLGGRAPERP
jgi:hypothetical protein